MTAAFEVDRALYPFASHTLEVDGGRLHYVDEGTGPAVVMVHGTPTWSFLYRELIAGLAATHRVIAPDHLGFGLSDKPRRADYRPIVHATNLRRLIDTLGLEQFVLVVHDFGGPIGLSYAIEQPDRVRGLVLFNTWLWSVAGTPAERVSRLMSSRLGRFLYERLNFSARFLVPLAFGDRSKLTPQIHRHYLAPFSSPAERHAPWVFARELLASGAWYESLWSRRAALADKPALLLWGMKDPAFRRDALDRWRGALPQAEVVEFADAGHFVQEEAPAEALVRIRAFLAGERRELRVGEG